MRNKLCGLILLVNFLGFPTFHSSHSQDCDPEHLSTFGGEGSSVEILDNRAFLAEGFNLTILDVSDPESVFPLSRFPLPFQPYDLAVDGTRAVLSGGESATACVSIDVTDAAFPRIESVFDLPKPTFDIALSGSLACLAYGPEGVQLMDLSDPVQPVFGGFLDTDGQPFDVDIQGDLVFVADSFRNALILDASNPAVLPVVGTLNLEGGSSPEFLKVLGNKLYLVSYSGELVVADLSNPRQPQEEGSVLLSGFFRRGFAVTGTKALITNERPSPTFTIVDVSVPANPVVSATYSLGSDPRNVAAAGGLAGIVVAPDDDKFDGDFLNGLAFYDISARKGATPLRPYRTPYAPTFAKAIGNILYVVDEATYFQRILHLMDLSNPFFPMSVGTHPLPEEPYEIQVRGNLAYVDVYASGIQILDVSDPSTPALLNQINTPGLANDLELDGDRIYVADGEAGISVYDAVNPVSPTLVGSWPNGPYEDYAEVILPVGDLAYVADGAGLHVLDVSNLSAISVAGSEPAFPRVFDMALDNGLIYGGLAGGVDGDGVQIADVSNPADPVLRGYWEGFDLAGTSTLFKLDTRVFLGTFGYGLQILDVSDPDAPVSCGGAERPSEEVYATISGSNVYVSGIRGGVQVFGVGCQNTPDVNRDTAVDAKDLLLILEALKRPPSVPQPEDVNCDGVLDTDDVIEFEQAWKTVPGAP